MATGKNGSGMETKNEKLRTKCQRHPLDVCNFHKKFNTSAARELQQFPGMVQIKKKRKKTKKKTKKESWESQEESRRSRQESGVNKELRFMCTCVRIYLHSP